MGSLTSSKYQLLYTFQFFLLMQSRVFCYQYKVGDLDAWGIPTSANPHVYIQWSKNHILKIGDSLLFLYPPSQDSVIQVTEQSYNSCNLTDPMLYMNNGNSLFNITSPGEFYFSSGAEGHCEKSQKLHISVLSASAAFSPSYGPTAAFPPSYPTVFGSIPAPPSSSHSLYTPLFMSAAFGFLLGFLVSGSI
uniref:Putative stellacyanin n=1 Tax=Davidia involucrata TaxID=16924 RepID=A0A5B7BP87_DAVIN